MTPALRLFFLLLLSTLAPAAQAGTLVLVSRIAPLSPESTGLAMLLRDMLELRIRVQVEERRLTLLDAAIKTVTQRVNLFDKVLIPRTRENIRRIRISLSDAERAAVVNVEVLRPGLGLLEDVEARLRIRRRLRAPVVPGRGRAGGALRAPDRQGAQGIPCRPRR